MNHKVLLADDSLTIQKVIKITLANQPYEITDCSSEDELFHQLILVKPKLVFLDFNLSEKFTGYELTTKIKSALPSTKVLLLLGTFDSVDDAAMTKCGASDKIVKPFDSNKFISICKQLIDTFADDEDIPYPEKKINIPSMIVANPDDQWIVNHSVEQKFTSSKSEVSQDFPTVENPLTKEMSEWGISVPEIIDQKVSKDNLPDLPPVIAKTEPINSLKEKSNYDQKFPQSVDLDYPSLSSTSTTQKVPNLVSIDNFNFNDTALEIEGNFVPDETDINSLEAQIRDEVEGNLWQVDEFEDLKKEVASKIEEVKSHFQPSKNDFDESLFKPLDENEKIDWPTDSLNFSTEQVNLDTGTLKAEMEVMVKKYVKEYLDQMLKANAEKVAWDVIPDLAENLIRQELSKISAKILSDET